MVKTTVITPETIKAARAYLGISQGELAENCNISRTAIASIENKVFHAKPDTLNAINSYFWGKGIEFLPEGGFRPHDDLVTILEGDEGIRKFFFDVMKSAELFGGEFLVNGMDEVEFYELHQRLNIQEEYDNQMGDMDNVTYRVITTDRIKDKLIPPYAVPYATYKVMPDDQISSTVPFYIYGDKLAIFLKGMTKVVIIKDGELVEAYRQIFNALWESQYATRVYTK
ncbi:MAG: helix-turn-helix transcriptional regulator [Alphaproteobacteria bacterium]|nr:helix-turn-helix transcriptional regulator [Alphaproteobacteria bacterium]